MLTTSEKVEVSPRNPNAVPRPIMANLVVGRDNRKRGIGKALIKEAEAKAKKWGYNEILLLVDEVLPRFA